MPDAQDLSAILHFDERLAAELSTRGLVTPQQIDDCLRAQSEAYHSESPALPRLRDLLVEKGYVSRRDLEQTTIEMRRQPAEPMPVAPAEGLPPEVASAMERDETYFGLLMNDGRPRYVRIGLIGRGGMGIVWKAWDRVRKDYVALKILIGSDIPEDIHRFRREGSITKALSHTNIVPIYDVGICPDPKGPGVHFIAMRYIDGRTGEQLFMSGRRSAGLRRALEAVRDSARALQHAHDNGFIHRDMKPSNLILDRKWNVYVTDFGLARSLKSASRHTFGGMLVGTPSFMSPEQALGKVDAIDTRSDVYGLGATLYAMMTARPPFEGNTAVEIAMKAAEQEPPKPRRLAPRMHVDIETIILKAMEKDPSRRYRTAAAFADDVDRYLAGEAIRAQRPRAMRRLARAARRHRAITSSLVVGAILVVCFSGYLFWLQWTARDADRAEAARLVHDAQAMLQQGKDEQARQRFSQAVNRDPENADAVAGLREMRIRFYRNLAERAVDMQAYPVAADLIREARDSGAEPERLAELSRRADGIGTLRVTMPRPGMRVTVTRINSVTLADAGDPIEVGEAPLDLAWGAYRLTVEGMQELPVRIERTEDGSGSNVAVDVPARVPEAMVWIPAGTFTFGGAPTSSGLGDQNALQQIPLNAFFIDRDEITNAEFARFLDSIPDLNRRAYHRPTVWPGEPDAPVRGVDWPSAMQYAAWAGMRLPTEYEWEKAARGIDDRIFAWGYDARIVDTIFDGGRAAIERYDVSPYGVRALSTGAAEWVYDLRWRKQIDQEPVKARGGYEAADLERERVLFYRVDFVPPLRAEEHAGLRGARSAEPPADATPSRLAGYLDSPDMGQRLEAVRLIGALEFDARARALLGQAARDAEDPVAWEAIRVLMRADPDYARELGRTGHPLHQVRAAFAAAWHGEPADRLLELAAVEEARQAAAFALTWLGDPRGLGPLAIVYAETNNLLVQVQTSVLSARLRERTDSRDAVRALAAHPDTFVRTQAVQWMLEGEDRGALPILAALSRHDPASTIRTVALNAMSALSESTVEMYTVLVELDDPRPVDFYYRGYAYLSVGRHEEAWADFDAGLARVQAGSAYDSEIHGKLLYKRGHCHEKLGRRDAALADYEEAIRVRSDLGAAYAGRGLLRLAGGDTAGAIEDFERYLKVIDAVAVDVPHEHSEGEIRRALREAREKK